MSTLPHRRHGGDRLNRALHRLPAGSGYIMTLDRCSDRPKAKRLGDQDATACAARAVGVPAQRPDSKLQAVMSDPRPGGWHDRRPTPAPNARNGNRPGNWPHSTPIARATVGAV
jgi:hypothetical protein